MGLHDRADQCGRSELGDGQDVDGEAEKEGKKKVNAASEEWWAMKWWHGRG